MIDENRKKALVVISLGAGVQSSTMAIMAANGELPKQDCAIFADTGYEPKAVYRYLEFLKKILPYPVYVVSKGNIRDDMIAARGTTDFVVHHFLLKKLLLVKRE